MALPENRADRLRCFRNALRNWASTGFVNFKPVVKDYLQDELADWSQREIARLLHEHVENGGKIDEQPERRPEWKKKYDFHFDLRVTFGTRRVYFEMVLDVDDPDDPYGSTITVVSIRDV